jgi:hypothetical protein
LRAGALASAIGSVLTCAISDMRGEQILRKATQRALEQAEIRAAGWTAA